MMGALEEPKEEAMTPHRQAMHHSPPRVNDTRNTMVLEELETSEDRRRSRRSPRRRFDSPEERGLRSERQMSERRGRSGERFHQYQDDPNVIPRYLKVEAERDIDDEPFRLPPIPMPAWAEVPQGPLREDNQQVPLLQLERGRAPPMAYHGPHQVPERNLPRVSPGPPSQPPPSYQESFFIPPVTHTPEEQRQTQRVVPQSIEMPLLKLVPEDKPYLGPQNMSSFGRLLDPALLVAHEQELQEKEMSKYKHAREFFNQQVYFWQRFIIPWLQ